MSRRSRITLSMQKVKRSICDILAKKGDVNIMFLVLKAGHPGVKEDSVYSYPGIHYFICSPDLILTVSIRF